MNLHYIILGICLGIIPCLVLILIYLNTIYHENRSYISQDRALSMICNFRISPSTAILFLLTINIGFFFLYYGFGEILLGEIAKNKASYISLGTGINRIINVFSFTVGVAVAGSVEQIFSLNQLGYLVTSIHLLMNISIFGGAILYNFITINNYIDPNGGGPFDGFPRAPLPPLPPYTPESNSKYYEEFFKQYEKFYEDYYKFHVSKKRRK